MKAAVIASFALLALIFGAGLTPLHAEDPLKLLFVDTGNTGRSITAETIARIHAAERRKLVLVISRGLDTDPFQRTVETNFQVLWAARGVDLSAHRADQISPQDIKHASLILTMTAKHKARILEGNPDAAFKTFTLVEYVSGGTEEIDDAFGKPMEFYQKTLMALDTLVPQAVDKALADGAPKKP